MEKIRKILKKNRLENTVLAKAMGCSANWLGRVLNERAAMSKDFHRKMKDALKEILDGYKERKTKELEAQFHSIARDIKKIEEELDKALLK